MPTSPFEVIAGPATVYLAPVGEAFPDIDEAPAGNWASLGDTEGGVQVTRPQPNTALRTDQHLAPVKFIRTEIDLQITFSIVELTLENLAKVLNGVAVTTNAGPPSRRSMPIAADQDMQQYAMLIRFDSPYFNGDAQWQIPRVVMTADPDMTYGREDKTVCTTEWMGVADPNAATHADWFGSIVAQDA
jgi:hypothetical protein